MGRELEVRYVPGGSAKLEGEVVGRTIFIFTAEDPVRVLQHEFFDYLICKAIRHLPFDGSRNGGVQGLSWRR